MVSHRTTIGWNKNIAYLKSYISEDDFTACMDRRMLYKGFIKDVGYASSICLFNIIAAPPLIPM